MGKPYLASHPSEIWRPRQCVFFFCVNGYGLAERTARREQKYGSQQIAHRSC
jgi:hypothetical protein